MSASSTKSKPAPALTKPGALDVANLVDRGEPKNQDAAGSSAEALGSFLGTPVSEDAFERAKAGPAKKPMLDFDEQPEDREWVKWKEKGYEIRLLDEFGIAEQHRLTRDGREFSKIMSSEAELPAEEQAAQDARLVMLKDRLFDALIVASEEERATFSDAKRAAIIMGFMPAPLHQVVTMLRAMAQEAQSESTGESSSVG